MYRTIKLSVTHVGLRPFFSTQYGEEKRVRIFYLSLLLLLFCAPFTTKAQTTIWSEDFNSYTDTTGYIGPGYNSAPQNILRGDYPSDVSKWTLDLSSAELRARFNGKKDFFLVANNSFQAQDVNGTAIWNSESIDISHYEDISISAEVWQVSGTMESGDSINFYYRLDNGAWKTIQKLSDDISNSPITITLPNIAGGTTLQLRVSVIFPDYEVDEHGNPKNNHAEAYAFDDIVVQGTELNSSIIGEVTQPTCATPTGSVILTGLPTDKRWQITATPAITPIVGQEATTTIGNLAPGTYKFTVKTENTNDGLGLKGEYFNYTWVSETGSDFFNETNKKETIANQYVNFNWGEGRPTGTTVNINNFAARWTGQVKPKYTEAYTFYTESDDGIKLTVDGTVLINNWTLHGPVEDQSTTTLNLKADHKYDITLEFFEHTGGAVSKLKWQSNSQGKEIIPASRLYSSSAFVEDATFAQTIPVEIESTCTEPDIPTLTTVGTNPVCAGENVTLNISGNLNDADHWAIYTGSCGGTLVGTTTGSTFNLGALNSTETYFVRGEGTSTESTCAEITVSVNNPGCSITGTSNVCPLETNINFSSVPGMAAYNWTVASGNATINSAGNTESISVNAGSQNFVLELTVTDAQGCSKTCTHSVNVSGPITLEADKTDVNCASSNNGSIDIKVPHPIQFGSGYIDTGSKLLRNRSQFTLEGWMKLDNNSSTAQKSFVGQNDVIEFGFENGRLTCWTAGGSNVYTDSYPADSKWHHVAAVGNGSNIKLYIDGTLKATGGSYTTNYGNSNGYTIKIGAGVWNSSGNPFPGKMMKIGIWSTALNASQISNLAAKFHNYQETEAGLLAGYNFYEGTGTTLASSTSTANGTFSGTLSWINGYSYTWTQIDNPGFSANTQDISNLEPGTYNVLVSNSSFSCPSNGTWEIEILDNVAPVPTVTNLPAINEECAVTALTAPTANDNCAGTVTGTHNAILPITASTTITWTYTDDNGNTSTQTQEVVIINEEIDIEVEPVANSCQTDQAGTTTITWDITKLTGADDWTYDFAISNGSSTVDSGANVSASGNIQISYTTNNTSGIDQTFTLTLSNVRNNCGSTEAITTNNTNTTVLHGVPATGPIVAD